MSWLSDLFGGSHPTNPYSQAQIIQFQIQALQDQKNSDPAGWEQRYGRLTPTEVYNLGMPTGDPAGQDVVDEAGNHTRQGAWTQAQIDAVNKAKQAVPDVPDVPPDTGSSPPPPPDTGGGDTGPPPYSGLSAREKLDQLLPTGFESNILTSADLAPGVEAAFQKERGGAQQFISNALKRGTLTETGSRRALDVLGGQDTGVRSRLQGLADTMLGTEQAKLRDLANTGRSAAAGVSGEFFDPTPYKTGVDQELASFKAGLPGSYTSGAPENLYDTNALLLGSGGVTGPQNLSYDPYAQEGGQLRTGTEDTTDQGTPPKKRTTAVF